MKIRISHNGYALAHPKGLVAFLPLKINKEKKQLLDQCGVIFRFFKKVF
jgi:hypothetical protein